jgi:hypothetical protein
MTITSVGVLQFVTFWPVCNESTRLQFGSSPSSIVGSNADSICFSCKRSHFDDSSCFYFVRVGASEFPLKEFPGERDAKSGVENDSSTI